MTLALYGIVRADHPLPAGLRAVVLADLAVVVSDLGSGVELTAEDARSHLDVLCALMADGPVLPLRFGSVGPDDDSVRDNALRPDPEGLRLALDRLTGLVEARVHLTFDETAVLAALADARPTLTRPVTGFEATIEQGRQIADQVRAWIDQRAGELLAGLATETVALGESDDGGRSWALLVRANQLDRIAAAVEALPDTVTARVLAPLPPYNFLSLRPKPASRWGFG